jgi:hypothetical protein
MIRRLVSFRKALVPEAYVPGDRYIPTAARFFEELDRSELPEAIRAPIGNVLKIFLEDDEDTVPPDPASFSVFLRFLRQRSDFPLPSIGVNRDGRVVAVWQNPAFRVSYEFLPAGSVKWASTERQGETIVVRDGLEDLDAPHSDFSCLRGTPIHDQSGT